MYAVLFAALLALILHLLLGWQFAVLGAILGGYLSPASGWKTGLTALFAIWCGLMLWNYFMAPQSIQTLFSTMSGILGGLPSFAFPMLTLLVASVLGALGGSFGAQLAQKRTSLQNKR
jgi:MFS-type transporter involved in bile tolerance (Atg22 family)